MPRKKKYENALIVKDILARECNHFGDMQGTIMFRFLDLKRKDDRAFLRREIAGVAKIFNAALKELEEKEKENGCNDKHTDESEEKTKKSKKK